MKKLFVFFMVVGMAIVCSGSVLAYTTYELTATIKPWNSDQYSSFSLLYEDKNNNMRFSYDELIRFDGVWRYPNSANSKKKFTVILGVPTYQPGWEGYVGDSPLTDDGGYYGIYGDYRNKESWHFGIEDWSDSTNEAPSNWTYSQKAVAPVPVPPSVWFLGSGLIGLVGLRRKFFRK